MALTEGEHVMLSYNWNSKALVSKIYNMLVDEGIKPWMDINGGMGDNVNISMAEGVENAAVVCCFMTPDYQNSDNCRLELEYANKKKKRIIPCMLGDKKDKKWSPSGWLGIITAALNYVNIRDDSESNIRSKAEELINRIRNSSPIQSTGSSSKSNDFFEPVKQEYLRNSHIQRIMNEEKSFPMERSYINLAIVETEEQQEKEKKLRQIKDNDAIIGTFEEIYGTKTVIDVKDIFEKCKDQTKKVLVLGRAGIGKSTFCRYVTYRWAKGEIWPQYQLVILIQLRLLTSSRYPVTHSYSPVDLVKKEYFPCDTMSEEDRRHFKQECDKGHVLWILDGYDEFVQNIPEQLTDVFHHICKTQHHILTSRPYSIALPYDVRMEITGFTDDNIAEYVEQFFDQIKDQLNDASSEGQNLLNFLTANPSIWGVAHIPVNLELICSLWGDIDRSEARIVTMTGLYDNMTEWLCRRYLAKQKILSMIEINAMFKDDVYEYCKKELVFLENLAFNAMENNTLVLQPALLAQALKDANGTSQDTQHILNIGILKSFNAKPTDNQTQTRKDYYFVHLSFQEHFAARYLVNALNGSSQKKAIEFINSNKYNQRFALLFAFASGLLIENNFQSSLNTFWDTILDEPLDLVGLRHIQLIISCIEEASDKSDLPRHSALIYSISKWIERTVSMENRTISEQLVNSLQRSVSLMREQIIIDQLIELLQSQNDKTKKNVCYLIAEISISNPQPQILFSLVNTLCDENSGVRWRACRALGEMGEQAATNEVISKLVSLLGDENLEVIERACTALGKMGEKAATNEVISKLVSLLEDENKNVRKSACEALGEMGEKAATNEVISKLVSPLRDENENVTDSAYKTLDEMGEKAATNEVISEIVSLLGDEQWNVRHRAYKAFGKMGEKAATNEVISALVSALRNENSYAGWIACYVLGEMGEKAATNEVISNLVSLLVDKNSDVRYRACYALDEMGEKAATNEVIGELVSLLEDENDDVRVSASKALGQMGEKAATNEVISKLVSLLGDENSDVRRWACNALDEMGEKAATNEVISELVSALGDKNSNVRESACYALGKMSEKAATNEVISALVSALGNENSNVGWAACSALRDMGEKAATKELISKLVSLLADEDLDVRHRASCVLDGMGEKAATNEVISNLVSALGDEDWDVRNLACICLCQMDEKAAMNEVISKLVSLLGDENDDVRESAYKTLVKMGETAATNEVISKLVSALRDENLEVRSSACYALGKMNEKAATNEVISKLVSLLEDENKNVRKSACEALGEMGEKAVTNEVISKLVSLLGDENDDVRRSACYALGEMGEKAGTNQVIRKLLEIYLADNAAELYDAPGKTFEKVFTSFEVITLLETDTVEKLVSCLNGVRRFDHLRCVSPEILIEVFLHTKMTAWLPVVTLVALRQGCGVTIRENTIVVYGSKEPVKIHVADSVMRDQLVNAFIDQAVRFDLPCVQPQEAQTSIGHRERFDLPCEPPSKADVKREMVCSVCNLL